MLLSTATRILTNIAARSRRRGIASMGWFALLLFLLPQPLRSQQSSQALFQKNCAGCHGEDARGSAKAPGLAMNQRVAGQSPEELSAFLEQGNIAGGMPSFADLSAADRAALGQVSASSQRGNHREAAHRLSTRREKSPGGRRSPATG